MNGYPIDAAIGVALPVPAAAAPRCVSACPASVPAHVSQRDRIALEAVLSEPTLDLPALVRRVETFAEQTLECERSIVLVADWGRRSLRLVRDEGSGAHDARLPIDCGLAGCSATRRVTVNVPAAVDDPRFDPELDRRIGIRSRSVLCVPLLGCARSVVGVCQCINHRDGAFAPEAALWLEAVAPRIGVALGNAALFAREASTRRYLEQVQESVSSAVVTLDDELRVMTCNGAARELFPRLARCSGCAHPPGPRPDLRDVLADHGGLLALVEHAYRCARPVIGDDVVVSGPDRRTSTAQVRIVPLEQADGGSSGLVLVIEDITRERRLKHAFQRYLSPAVIDHILEEPGRLELGGERRDVTALFTDLEGFTGLAERVGPERLVDLLQAYFDAVCAVVFEHEGTIDKIVGDSLHVLFNAPLAQDDHATRAVRCALAIDARTRQLRSQGRHAALGLGRTRIGISSGPAVVGNFGGEARFDYTAHGDAINVASRLEGANKYLGTAICVSDSTVRACDDLRFRPIARLRLKGRRDVIAVHEPLAAHAFPERHLRRYERAYALMAGGAPSARRAMASLARCCPRDRLCRMHAKRLEDGERSDLIRLTGK